MAQTAIAATLRFEPVQAAIDRISRTPNLGILVSAVAIPISATANLRLYDDLMNASWRRRRWRQLYPLGVGSALVLCWRLGVPRDRALHWQFGGYALEHGNGWQTAFEFLSGATAALPCIEGFLASQRIVLHLYATGNDRALCLRSLFYSLAWSSLGLAHTTVALQAGTRFLSGQDRFQVPLALQQGLALTSFTAQMLGGAAPRWSLGQASGPMRNRLERRIERLLRTMLVVSCYEDVRHLAFTVQDVVPRRPPLVRHDQTGLGHVYRLAELDLLLQMYKTSINDARLVLARYVDAGCITRCRQPGLSAPERAAQVLANALDNVRQGQEPSTVLAPDNPLRDAVSFNDDRFLAAVWRAYKRSRTRSMAHTTPVGASG